MAESYLKIGGELISNAILVNVEVTQELNQHSSCFIECRQTEDMRFPVEDSLGKDVQVLTYDQNGAGHVCFDGFVLEADLEYEIFGSYTARLTAVSRSYKLDCTPQEAYWRKKTLSDIAQTLATEDGLKARVQCASKPRKNYVQWGETDFAFLKRIADDYHAWIRPTVEGIEICDSFQQGTTIQWRLESGLLSFRMKGRLAQPSFQGTHYNARTMMSKTLRKIHKDPEFTGASGLMVDAVRRSAKPDDNWQTSELKTQLPRGHVFTDGRAATEHEFQELLERESMRAIGGGLVGCGVSRCEQLRAGDLVEIRGNLDAQGTYGLIKVVHRWTSYGYTNDFWCTPWKQYISSVPPSPHRIFGVVTARVTSNKDPRSMGRLQVQYDWQEDGATEEDRTTGWARMATPHAGGDRGFLFLPEVGDEVLVTFEHGDPERPYIVGSLWNGVDLAPRQEFWGGDVDPNDVKRIVTKSGHRIQLSDKEGKEAIVIATPSKLKLSLLEKTNETGRPMILLHAIDGDIVFSAPEGRIHFHSKWFSRETGEGGAGYDTRGTVAASLPSAPPPPASSATASTGPIPSSPASSGGVALSAAASGLEGHPASKPTAGEADRAVLERFGTVIPSAAKTPSAASVTVLQDTKTFQAALKSRHPGIEHQIDINSIYGESYQKTIFVNKDKDYSGTLYHEAIHHYSHSDFKSKFGSYNGVRVNEGATEYFTRSITTPGRNGHYEVETRVVQRAVAQLSRSGQDGNAILEKAFFQGDASAIKKVEEALK